jgi:hypothetical protein
LKEYEENLKPKFEILESEKSLGRLSHTLKSGFGAVKPLYCYDRCIKTTIADKKWDEQLKIKTIREHKKIGKISEAKNCYDAFTRCVKQFCRHYHNMSCITWILEVLSVIAYVIDVPLDIYFIMKSKFYSDIVHDIMLRLMIAPSILMLIIICCRGNPKRPCRRSFFAEYILCCISHN